jgi:hypothetical protein
MTRKKRSSQAKEGTDTAQIPAGDSMLEDVERVIIKLIT